MGCNHSIASFPSVSSYPFQSRYKAQLEPEIEDSNHLHLDHIKCGLIGLQNLGNTCFMNTALQCLSNTAPLADFFLFENWERELNESNPIGYGGEIAKAFSTLVLLIWRNESKTNVVSPHEIKKTLGKYFNQFRGCEQHDAQELLSFLLDGLHEDLNRVKRKPYIEDSDDESKDEVFLANKQWSNYLLRNRSIIVDLAQGQLRSTLVCHTCQHKSVKFDPYMYLSLPVLDTRDKTSLLSSIAEFSKPETLSGDCQWYCPKCKDFRDATKTIQIWSTPPILIIHLKRFLVDSHGQRRKIKSLVEFPTSSFDLSDIIMNKSDKEQNNVYNVYSVSNHHGSLQGGHYTAVVKNRMKGGWFLFNDSSVKPVNASAVCTEAAYVLFFHRSGILSENNADFGSSQRTNTLTDDSAEQTNNCFPLNIPVEFDLNEVDSSGANVVVGGASVLCTVEKVDDACAKTYEDQESVENINRKVGTKFSSPLLHEVLAGAVSLISTIVGTSKLSVPNKTA